MGALRAAAGAVDLTPPAGTWMTGFALRTEPATGVHDPLLARALLLEDGGSRLVIISCDLLGLAPEAVAEVRQAIAEQRVAPAANVLLACTHTHSGPASMPMRGVLGYVDETWLAEAKRKIVALVVGLPDRLSPACLAYASTVVQGIGYNRQDRSHPVDEELAALAVESPDGAAIATVINYATHPVVLGPANRQFSGDFPGAATRHLEQLRGGVGLFLQGACGDVDPVIYRDRGWGKGSWADVEEIGGRLAQAAAAALASAPRAGNVRLAVATEEVVLPLDPPPAPETLAGWVAGWEAERERKRAANDRAGALAATAMLQWASELRRAMEDGRVPRALSAEVFVAAINDVRLVGFPFEAYTDIGLEIKAGLRPLPCLFVSYANGLYGYCPTRWAKKQGGYGADTACRWFGGMLTAVGYGAAEALVSRSVALGRGLT